MIPFDCQAYQRWIGCDHPDLQIREGHCSLCYGGLEYCVRCGYELQTHELQCPDHPDFDASFPGLLRIVFWKDIPLELRLRQIEGVYLLRLHSGFIAIMKDGVVPPEIEAVLFTPPPVPGMTQDEAFLVEVPYLGMSMS
ncbi:hypothetical protein HGA91_02130 [candidate division WWE3 bacterium]|nr:hypothetical protein [candidate division WWE3 bacterium]